MQSRQVVVTKRYSFSSALAALIVSLSCAGTSFAQSFVNPSFEFDAWGPCESSCNANFEICASGWISSPNNPPSGYAHQFSIPSPNNCGAGPTPCGSQFVVLDSSTANPGESWIEQTISFPNHNDPLILEFAISSEFNFASQVTVTLTGATPLGPTTFTAPIAVSQPWDTWAPQTLLFKPNVGSSQGTIRFTHVTTNSAGSGVGLDCIGLASPVPAVSGWGLGALALLLLSGVAVKFGWRRVVTA